MTATKLFQPLKIGDIVVKHRIGMAPLTRQRASDSRVPGPLMTEYYSQRASVPGTLIITEGTIVSPSAGGGYPHAPGIWSPEQVAGWKEVTDAVHAKGSFIYCQLFALGRAADPEVAKKEGVDYVGPSAIPIEQGGAIPRAMTVDEIEQSVRDFAAAAKNAIAAGFDGIEIHGANGYLIDQFTQDVSNRRDDRYGGSIENRSRFFYEIMKAVVDAVGSSRVGIRLSPWSPFQAMKMENPIPQFTDIIDKANQLKLAFVHLVESRISGGDDHHGGESLEWAYEACERPLLVAGGYTLDQARNLVDNVHSDKDIVVVFGRLFISNPDLVFRFQNGLDLNPYNRKTFYTSSAVGYSDYPFSKEYLATV